MHVVLKVTSYKTYDVYFDDVESLEDAKGLFEPEDLEDSVETGGADTIDEAIEVVECPDCDGWGRLYPSESNVFVRICEKCDGNGWINKDGE